MSEIEIKDENKNKQTIEVQIKASEMIKQQIELEALKKDKAELETKLAEQTAQIEANKSTRQSVGGTVPLNKTAGGQPTGINKDTFNSAEELVNEMLIREQSGDPEAKKAINAMWDKWIVNVHNHKDSLYVGELNKANKPLTEQINEQFREELKRKST
jgi:hypothetical protein